ncbi:Atxe2 family lasso peptide isopeptidase [Sphingobium naphthae]|nr:Atxe2 family lasso peptide isopeptidase [Sphingobium naphthae]
MFGLSLLTSTAWAKSQSVENDRGQINCRAYLANDEGDPTGTSLTERLVSLRLIGTEGLSPAAAQFSVSPSGKLIAALIRRANTRTNRYCQGLAVIDVTSGKSRFVDVGGDLITARLDRGKLHDLPSGSGIENAPVWSPDGKAIAYLWGSQGKSGLRIVYPDSSAVRTIKNSTGDIDEFSWSGDSKELRYLVSTPVDNHGDEELRAGFKYDGRFWPLSSSTPYPATARPISIWEHRINSPHGPRLIENGLPATAISRNRPRFPLALSLRSAQLTQAGGASSPLSLKMADGSVTVCPTETCGQILKAWADERTGQFILVTMLGFARSEYAILGWAPGTDRPRTIHRSSDQLLGCAPMGDRIACAREASLRPRHIVSIEIESGKVSDLYDPNPDSGFDNLVKVERLHWKNAEGQDCFGDLVLPRQDAGSQKLPLVVVQYVTRGFLKGATGDEYPIIAIAAAGFAVLSFNRPRDLAEYMREQGREIPKDYVSGWRDRESVQSALFRGMDLVASMGVTDERAAITGLSDGASTATYALSTSTRFSTGILSTCCEDPFYTEAGLGSQYRDERDREQVPLPAIANIPYWRRNALALATPPRCVPLLIQAADSEFRLALSTYETWRQYRYPIEFYVFANEEHIKTQPAHRLAIYDRNIDWLRRWRDGALPACPTQPSR